MAIRLKIVVLSSQHDQDAEGKHPICLQFTKDRKVNRIRLGKSVPLTLWQGAPPEYVRGKNPNRHPNARFLNLFLTNELARAERIVLQSETEGKDLTYPEFRQQFLNLQETDFAEWHKKFLKYRMGITDLKEATLKRYDAQLQKVKQFRPNLKLQEITPTLLSEFNTFLAEELSNAHNTRHKAFSYLKSIFDYAKKKGAVTGDPFEEVNVKPKYAPREFLQESEVVALVNLYRSNALKPTFQHVLRKFIWCCYTGQSFSDMLDTRYEDILDIEGHKCIQSQRNKTEQPYFVPLLPIPLELISPFPEDRKASIFKSISNQKYNTTLKEIVKIVGITKNVTSHMARHTCGHLLVSHGVSRDYVMTILGHSSIDMTKHYSQIMPGDTIRHILGKFEQ